MQVIGYTRVSTEKQVENLNFQIESIFEYCNNNNIIINNIVEEVGSAYYYDQNNLRKLLNQKDINIIIKNTSRFCRKIKFFEQFIEKIFNNNISIHFIDEMITLNKNTSKFVMNTLYRYIHSHQQYIDNMIDNISDRVDRGWDFKRDSFGRQVYYSNNLRHVIENDNEQKIIKLIKALKNETSVERVNYYLNQVLPNNNQPIEFIDYNGNITNTFQSNKLDYNVIANLLNSYNITNRGKKWNINSINYVMKYC